MKTKDGKTMEDIERKWETDLNGRQTLIGREKEETEMKSKDGKTMHVWKANEGY